MSGVTAPIMDGLSRSILSDGSDLRFAVPRCWSEGDSNCRSSLRSLYLGKARAREIFNAEIKKTA